MITIWTLASIAIIGLWWRLCWSRYNRAAMRVLSAPHHERKAAPAAGGLRLVKGGRQ